MKTFDIELFQHKNDRLGYVAIYKVENEAVPTRELEYNTAQDNCLWSAQTLFTIPHLGQVGTVEKIIRVQVASDGLITAPEEYHQWFGSATGRFLNIKLQLFAK